MPRQLFRVHAYTVTPARTAGSDPPDPTGGAIDAGTEIQTALTEATAQSRLEERTSIDLDVDPTTRTNIIRDGMLAFGFDSAARAATTSLSLARSLSNAMDLRSQPCLFVMAAERDGPRRRVTIWTFPRDRAFQFVRGRTHPSIRLLNDVFSRTSRLRKAALFEGENRRTDFLSGRALDLQAHETTREVADFWISRFLKARLSIAAETGTRMLANAIREAYDSATDPAGREALWSALMVARTSPQRRWTIRQFADRHLEGPAKDALLHAVRNAEALSSSFEIDRETFDKTISLRVFRLDSGVYVSAPFDQINQSVLIEERTLDTGNRQYLRCEGAIVEEKVRARHA